MKWSRTAGALGLWACVGAVVALAAPARVKVYEKDSKYHHIRVDASADGFVYLSFDRTRGLQSAVKLGSPGYLALPYTRTAFAGLAFLGKDPKDVLFVGLGGGSMPMFMRHHYPRANVDIAEIDPQILEVAKEYFDFKEDGKMKVHIKDGRDFIRRTKRKYDIIFLDAYNSKGIQFHLTTREFLAQVRARLKPQGLVVSNIWSPTHNKFHDAMMRTYQAVFPELYLFRAGNTGNELFVATPWRGQVPHEKVVARAREIAHQKPFSYDLVAVVAEQYKYASKMRLDASVLTDDYAPVNILNAD